jgi:hypothetical protein
MTFHFRSSRRPVLILAWFFLACGVAWLAFSIRVESPPDIVVGAFVTVASAALLAVTRRRPAGTLEIDDRGVSAAGRFLAWEAVAQVVEIRDPLLEDAWILDLRPKEGNPLRVSGIHLREPGEAYRALVGELRARKLV